MKKLIGTLLFLFASVVVADNYTVQGSWTDTTTTGPEYVAQYGAQCQVDGVQVYEDMVLASSDFSTSLVFAPTSVLECRAVNINQVGPVFGDWSPWVTGVVATAPTTPSTIILIQIHSVP